MGAIYSIKCIANGKVYIGLTGQKPIKRWQIHRSRLRGNNHPSLDLQHDFNKYGEDNFKFTVLETGHLEALRVSEIFYIKDTRSDEIDRGYNKNSNKSKTHASNERRVASYGANGALVKIYENIQAVEKDGFRPNHVSNCCNGKMKTHGKLSWKKYYG